MDRSMELKFQSFAPMISNTPLLEIQYKYRGNDRRIFAKAEYYNLSGSIKAVSYTHLDVYKRQPFHIPRQNPSTLLVWFSYLC